MAIILDADVIIRGEKGAFDLKAWLGKQSDKLFEVAAITVAELWHGVERAGAPHGNRRLQYLEGLLAPLPIIPYTEQTAYVHARLWAELEATGKMLGAYDLIVAATALERDSEVATFNERHFGIVPGLQIVRPE